MTVVENRALMFAALEAARIAGERAMKRFRAGVRVEFKPDGSPVTAADREAEGEARDWIEGRFPADGIVGEELGTERPQAARRWLVDPIDGTKSFVRGVPLWGSLVAVAEGDRVLAGAAYFPAVGELLSAGAGVGCFRNGEPCRVSEVSELGQAAVLATDAHTRDAARQAGWSRLAAAAAIARTWGDCYGHMLVATGRAEVMLDPVLADWDAAAIRCIVEEAGGVFTDWGGARTAFGGSAVSTNGTLAEAARAVLGGRT